jgi:hypothetical protein
MPSSISSLKSDENPSSRKNQPDFHFETRTHARFRMKPAARQSRLSRFKGSTSVPNRDMFYPGPQAPDPGPLPELLAGWHRRGPRQVTASNYFDSSFKSSLLIGSMEHLLLSRSGRIDAASVSHACDEYCCASCQRVEQLPTAAVNITNGGNLSGKHKRIEPVRKLEWHHNADSYSVLLTFKPLGIV